MPPFILSGLEYAVHAVKAPSLLTSLLQCQCPYIKQAGNSHNSGKTETFWSMLFSVFLFASFFCILSNRELCRFFFRFLLGVKKAQVNWQTRVSNKKKGFLNLWNYVQHVWYINVYLKYKSILLLNFGFFLIKYTMLRFRGGMLVFTHQRGELSGERYSSHWNVQFGQN